MFPSDVVEETAAGAPGGATRSQRLDRVEAQIARVCGRLNLLHAELVTLIAEALTLGAAEGHGLRSAGHWVAWQTGATTGRGAALARLAERASELPATIAKLSAGEVSIDQAAVIAARAPAWADAEVAQLATVMTPHQLGRVCAAYPQPVKEPRTPSYGVSTVTTDDGDTRIRALVPADVGAMFTTAMRAHLDALIDAHRAGTSPADGDDTSSRPTSVDALVRMTDRSLSVDARDRPHYRRHQVLVHVDAGTHHAQIHLGPALSDELRRVLCCDATYQLVYERDGRPIGVGTIRTIPHRTRIAVEHRDHGCRVPGCTRTWVQVHHIHHVEDGGLTETWNLIALCPHHHRLHHRGLLGITGANADQPDGITFTDRYGRTITGVTAPTPPSGPPGAWHPDPPAYQHPDGNRLNPHWLTLNATPPPPAEASCSSGSDEVDALAEQTAPEQPLGVGDRHPLPEDAACGGEGRSDARADRLLHALGQQLDDET
jgi:hypothetical protein